MNAAHRESINDLAAQLRRVMLRMPRKTRRDLAAIVHLAVAFERLKEAAAR